MTATHQIPSTTSADEPTSRKLRRRWPTLAGVALAVLVGSDLAGGAELAPILAASGLIYLGAAALHRPATAWPLFLATFAVLAVNEVAGGPDPTWVLLGLAVLLAGYGLTRGAVRAAGALPHQALAMLAVGTVAVATLAVGGTVGAYLVAAGLLGHAAWDVYHHRVNRVVVRSMAEFCFVLDTLLAIAVVVVAIRG